MKVGIPVYAIENLKFYQKNGILASKFAYYLEAHQHLKTAHRHSFYHLVLFTAGDGKQQLDFKTFDIKPDTIYFMIPGQVHQWHFNTAPDGYIVNFSADYFNTFLKDQNYLEKFRFFNGAPEDQVIYLYEEATATMSALFDEILTSGNNGFSLSDDLIKALLIKLFIHIEKIQPDRKIGQYNHTLLQNFKKLIEENFTKLKLPKQYAAMLYITPNHLNALTNDLLGTSAGQLIRDRVLLEAKRLLVNLDLNVTEIAEKLGFDDQSYFIKFFKKYEQNTPDKFRKLNHIN